MSVDFHVVIPARYQSSRLPGKLLMDLGGLTVLERVYHQAILAKPSSITIATDHEPIFQLAQSWGAEVVMTADHHESGTDRIAEVVAKLSIEREAIIVNVQGDEPFIPPQLIVQVARIIASSDSQVGTLCWPIEDEESYLNPNVVKVVCNAQNNALYFSRSPIPAYRDSHNGIPAAFRHIGLYAYRADFLLNWHNIPACEVEKAEMLEQLRILWAGYNIRVEEAVIAPKQDINTRDDLQIAREMIRA